MDLAAAAHTSPALPEETSLWHTLEEGQTALRAAALIVLVPRVYESSLVTSPVPAPSLLYFSFKKVKGSDYWQAHLMDLAVDHEDNDAHHHVTHATALDGALLQCGEMGRDRISAPNSCFLNWSDQSTHVTLGIDMLDWEDGAGQGHGRSPLAVCAHKFMPLVAIYSADGPVRIAEVTPEIAPSSSR
eukprot:FR742906.1.p1 GENE.FR742906.1~~FR742906.1.p1  ORF type:complete len:187 (+),score=3.00 FR742906.1:2-562(+)